MCCVTPIEMNNEMIDSGEIHWQWEQVSLLAACKKRGLPVLSVAGAGAPLYYFGSLSSFALGSSSSSHESTCSNRIAGPQKQILYASACVLHISFNRSASLGLDVTHWARYCGLQGGDQ